MSTPTMVNGKLAFETLDLIRDEIFEGELEAIVMGILIQCKLKAVRFHVNGQTGVGVLQDKEEQK